MRSLSLAAAVTLSVVLPAILTAQGRPNILFIMSDDHTAQAVGAYATLLKDLNPTPTIDTLAKEGITFENAFCTPVEYHHSNLPERAAQFFYMWDDTAFYAALRTLDTKLFN